MDALKKLMQKKMEKQGGMEPKAKEAKMELLKELREMASGMMKEDLDGHLAGIKKVTVASDSEEGLKEGLEKAEDMVEKKSEMPSLELDEDESEVSTQPLAHALEKNKDPASMSREELLAELLKLKQKV